MTFDTWQLLINFGTKPLDENERIFKSSLSNIDALIKSGKMVYGRITPIFMRHLIVDFIFSRCLLNAILEIISNHLHKNLPSFHLTALRDRNNSRIQMVNLIHYRFIHFIFL